MRRIKNRGRYQFISNFRIEIKIAIKKGSALAEPFDD
jgi:hypothetical protein